MADYHRTEGVCLRRLDYSDTSQVATFLTPDQGRLSFIAKGILRAPKRGVSTGLELLAVYDLVYTHRRLSSLANLTETCLRRFFRGMRQRIERIVCGYYAAELVLNFAAEGEPCRALYSLLLDSLERVDRGEGLGVSVLLLEIGALRHYGGCPTFNACAECGRPLALRGRLLFSPSDGGPLCTRCGPRLHPGPALGAASVKAARLSLLTDFASGEGERLPVLRVEPSEIVAASRLLRFHMSYLLGKELRMWKYLQGRRLSRALRQVRRQGTLRASHPPPPAVPRRRCSDPGPF